MMFLVKKDFIDKETKVLHKKGTIYETDNEKRALELKKAGFLGIELIPKATDEEPPKETKKQTTSKKKGEK